MAHLRAGRVMERNTLIEDAPQVSIRRAAPPSKLQSKPGFTSPLSDNFPTPKAISTSTTPVIDDSSSPGSSDTSDGSSLWSKRSSNSDFDEMYDITGSEDSESEGDVPIKLSNSMKKKMAMKSTRCPSLVIPSPTEWPTIEKLKSAVTPLSPPNILSVSPAKLAQLNSMNVTDKPGTPSLDGNTTDEEAGLSSCPSTPDIPEGPDGGPAWEVPIQLDPSSFSLLAQMHVDDQQETVIEIPPEATQEMQEILESPPLSARMRLETQNLKRPDPASDEADDELSALSVPSPGGFFASLNSSVARHTWSGLETVPTTSTASEFYGVPWRDQRVPSLPSNLPTSTATKFYGVPWQERPGNPVEQTIVLDQVAKEDPITAKKIIFSPTDVIKEVDELDEGYDSALKETAAANIDRTALWLNAQTDYMKALCEESDVVETFWNVQDAIPKTPDQTSPLSTRSSPSKKSVRFADPTPTSAESADGNKRISPIHDGTFWQGWRHTKRSQRARDVFQHRQARAESEHVKRTSCLKQHVVQLQGKYEITTTERPAPARPISHLMANNVEDEKTHVIQCAERERQALEQMQTSAWHLSAQKEINGGKLLTSPMVESFKDRSDVKILDLAGQVHCSWAWDVALEHPKASVYTIVSSDAEAHVAESRLEGPLNHSVLASPKTWELPFEDNYFDVISARNLYCHLRTLWPKGQAADEWDLTLRECLRILKPGGFLEFDLLDAELVHPEPASQALGVEFAFNLKTRGYDPTAGKNFLPRLKRAGFQSIKRAWIVLPVADVLPRWTDSGKGAASDSTPTEKTIGPNGEVEYYQPPVTGSTKDVRAITGIIGARMWEQWMLKLNSEMGRSEARCLEGVGKALEESGKGSAGWRCLVGWARKGE